MLTIQAHAKVNLFLNVVGRREDGYHLIDSLFAFAGLCDFLTFSSADDLSLAIAGPWSDGLSASADNLVLRAAALLRQEAGAAAGASILLEKQVPVAAGLGGGSADAAATLVGLDDFWKLGLPVERLEQLALRLGADVPACIRCRPVIARGVGEDLSPAPAMPDCGLLLVNPRVATPTPAVFKGFRDLNPLIRSRTFDPLPGVFEDAGALVAAIAPRSNDLLPAAIAATPAIADVLAALEALPAVLHAGLSGSGATCFALFDTWALATAGAAQVQTRRPDWWASAGRFIV